MASETRARAVLWHAAMPNRTTPHDPTLAAALGVVRRRLAARGRPRRVVVACSGGPDSVALLGLLHCLHRSEQVNLVVAHVDHGLRRESPTEAEHVRALSAGLGLECRVTRLDLSPGSGIPARARAARRAALQAIARAEEASLIALGHTATDQAETVLMHLGRGAGLEGLSGMAPEEIGPEGPAVWWRPILELTREETGAVAQRLGLSTVSDPTNENVRAPRIAVRSLILPVLRAFHPRAEVAIAAASDRVREAHEAVQWLARREIVTRRLPEGWSLRGLPELPRIVRTAWLREVCVEEGVEPSALGRRTLAAIDRAVCDAVGGSRGWDLRPFRRLWIESERLWVTTSTPVSSSPTEFSAPGSQTEREPGNH